LFSGAIVIATAAEMCGGLRSRAKAFSRGPKKQKQKFLALIRWSKSKGGSTAEGQNEPPPPTPSSASPPVRGWRPELAPVRSRDETRKGGTARGEHSDRGGGGGGWDSDRGTGLRQIQKKYLNKQTIRAGHKTKNQSNTKLLSKKQEGGRGGENVPLLADGKRKKKKARKTRKKKKK